MESLHFVYLSPAEEVLTDAEWRAVEQRLVANPRVGRVIQGTAGLRKMRAMIEGRGQRGRARIVCLYVEQRATVYFVFAYSKTMLEDLTPEERSQAEKLSRQLKGEA